MIEAVGFTVEDLVNMGCCSGFKIWGSGCRGSWFSDQASVLRVQGLKVQSLGFRVHIPWLDGFRVQGSGFKVQGSVFEVRGIKV